MQQQITKVFDFLVIGGGSGGLACARRAASYGAKCAIIEKGPLGGTCVNVGCVPKKVMYSCASIGEMLKFAAKDYGFNISDYSFDWNKIKKSRDAYIDRLVGIYDNNLKNDKVEVIKGVASFVDQYTLAVKANPNDKHSQLYEAKHILIASGGRPTIPEVPNAHLGITSDDFFKLDYLPKKVGIAGSGYIAVEIAGIFKSLGADVTLIIRRDQFLKSFDSSLRNHLMEEYANLGINLVTNTSCKRLDKLENGKIQYTANEDGKVHGDFDIFLWAVGRNPNVEIGLEKVGVKLNNNGFVQVDEYQNTTTNNIYAVGDVCGHYLLTPVAIAAGRKLADRVFNGQFNSKLDYNCIPTVIFSHPPIGTVGLTEEQAVNQFGKENIGFYFSKFGGMYYAVMEHKSKTSMKIIVKLPEQRILGMHVIGLGADEMIQGFAVAVKMGATKADLDNTMPIHPTASEEFITMKVMQKL